MSTYMPSRWLLQAAPPDMSESKIDARWSFGLYEVIDQRNSPMDPRVLHTVYRGAIELSPHEMPDANDPFFSAKLEEAVVSKWKRLAGL